MIFEGKCLSVEVNTDGIAELKFDLQDSSVNTMGLATVAELSKAVAAMTIQANEIKGLILTSAKKDFMVGANTFEFLGYFELPDDEFEEKIEHLEAQASVATYATKEEISKATFEKLEKDESVETELNLLKENLTK